MGTVAAARETRPPVAQAEVKRVLTGAEVAALYACVLLDIWRWQYSHPRLWILLLVVVFTTQVVHRDTLRDLGLTRFELRSSAQVVLPLMLAVYVPLMLAGFASGRIRLVIPDFAALSYLGRYGFWCLCQQYLVQSYFHNRLMSVIRNRHLSSLLVAVMFGAAHLPNPVLTAATTLGGFIFSEVFARHRNIWPLALAQTAGGFLVAAITPAGLIHNMRVGPGYWFWGLR
ncbi:MAG TPA: CPBP family intramembrane glutamic endopeptidase [Terriglobia bacterium]